RAVLLAIALLRPEHHAWPRHRLTHGVEIDKRRRHAHLNARRRHTPRDVARELHGRGLARVHLPVAGNKGDTSHSFKRSPVRPLRRILFYEWRQSGEAGSSSP